MPRITAAPGARYSWELQATAVQWYVAGLPSYRRLAAMVAAQFGFSIDPRTLNRWVDHYGQQALTPLEMSQRFAPTNWGGLLGIDGTGIVVHGQPWMLLIAVDLSSRDIVHALVRRTENAAGFTRLLTDIITTTRYPLKALVMDASGGFLSAWSTHFANLPLQLCRVHFLRRLDEYLPTRPYGTHRPDPDLAREYKHHVRQLLLAPTLNDAHTIWNHLTTNRHRYHGLAKHDPIRVLDRHLTHYLTHHTIPGLPADNNITEGVIAQLATKLDLTRGFATPTTAEHFTRLLTAWYRHKPFTDTTNGTNGQTPLTIANATLPTPNWLTNTQHQQQH